MSDSFEERQGAQVVLDLAAMIREQRDYLSELDGAIGDGDHGVNMAKGFAMAQREISSEDGLHSALRTLGRTLVMEIGGALGPLYGGFFKAMARQCKGVERIDAPTYAAMLEAAYEEIKSLGDAKVGDKTLVDTLDPAAAAFREAVDSGQGFAAALDRMSEAAEKGKDSTKELVARVGRSARLGERSRGPLDAGAVSCWLILDTMGRSMKAALQAEG